MEYRISKELFEAIYGKNIISFGFCVEGDRGQSINYNKYKILFDDGKTKYVSINDFFFDCKKWALNKGYYFEIRNMLSGTYLVLHFNYMQITDLSKNFSNLKSEQQTIFDACQWILENDNAKD